MTNEHYLEVAKECGACTLQQPNEELPYSISFAPEELDADTARICAEKDAVEEVNRLKDKIDEFKKEWEAITENRKLQLAQAKEIISMQSDAISSAINCFKCENTLYDFQISKLNNAIAHTPESIAAWEAEKLLPLQRQVAMLSDIVSSSLHCKTLDQQRDYNALARNAVANTQAAAEAFMNEHAAKVIIDFKRELSCIQEDASCLCTACWQHVEKLSGKAINELRAANKKESE